MRVSLWPNADMRVLVSDCGVAFIVLVMVMEVVTRRGQNERDELSSPRGPEDPTGDIW